MKRAIVAAPAAACIAALSHGAAPLAAQLPAAPAPPDASACPQRDVVLAELERLVPRATWEASPRAPGDVKIEVVDQGALYRVIAGDHVREYADEARDCVLRARVAAVFVALTMDPALAAAGSTAAPAAPAGVPAALAATAAPAVSAAPPFLHVDAGAAGGAGWGDGSELLQVGASLRASVGRGRFALVTGALLLAPLEASVGGLPVRYWRAPVDAGVRVRLGGEKVQVYGELGVVGALVSTRALELAAPRTPTAAELGARAALGARLGGDGARWSPFLAAHVELIPRPSHVIALPRGVVGGTPSWWLGASAGLSARFF